MRADEKSLQIGQALCRTRTGDPFLTMVRPLSGTVPPGPAQSVSIGVSRDRSGPAGPLATTQTPPERHQKAGGQLVLIDLRSCRHRGCPAEVVGSSTTGDGHVCRAHNVAEWGAALACNREPHYRRLGERLLKEAT